jgi:L-lysine 2,3-aminomutase
MPMTDSIELFPRAKRSGAPWKKALAEAIRDPDELIDILGLSDLLRPGARLAAQKFPFVVPRGFVSRMRRGDARDPLLLQVLPLGVEEESPDGFGPDPLREAEATVLPGLLKKYEGRVLLVAAGNCAINCRYCFRREFPYDETPRGLEAWRPAIERITADPTVTEVILSGGDPLVLSDATLEGLAQELAAIPHLKRLRVHSRLPIVLPERVNPDLLGWLTGTRLTPVMVVHSNHPAEVDGACAAALSDLVDGGILVLNQSVLLRGVNDSADTLARLSERLVELRVLPYYLHQLDPVRGAAHFHVDEARGLEIVRDLRRRLPGYAVPRYVRETPGAEGKTPIEDGAALGGA